MRLQGCARDVVSGSICVHLRSSAVKATNETDGWPPGQVSLAQSTDETIGSRLCEVASGSGRGGARRGSSEGFLTADDRGGSQMDFVMGCTSAGGTRSPHGTARGMGHPGCGETQTDGETD